MDAIAVVQNYLEAIHSGGWEAYLADEFTFGNNTMTELGDRESYILGAGQFFRATTRVEVIQQFQASNAVALVCRYATTAPDGRTGTLDVAEFMEVCDGKLTSNSIFFDSGAFARFMQGAS